jgi:hypothetical protein
LAILHLKPSHTGLGCGRVFDVDGVLPGPLSCKEPRCCRVCTFQKGIDQVYLHVLPWSVALVFLLGTRATLGLGHTDAHWPFNYASLRLSFHVLMANHGLFRQYTIHDTMVTVDD